MEHLKGKNLIIKQNGTAIAAAKSCDINVQAAIIHKSSPADGAWEYNIVGRKSWSVTVNKLIKEEDGSDSRVSDCILSVGDSVTLRMEVKDYTADYVTGSAIVRQFRVTGTVGNLVQGSFVFVGNGPLSW